jgi:hypothetical protein
MDALFLTGDSAPPETIREMLHAPGVRMFDFAQADAYVRRFRYLSKLELPPGSFDLGENLPPTAINMLAPTADLLAHSNLHPALSDLLLEAATEVHGGATLLQNAGQFPAPMLHDYPISADAARYYKSGKSFAYRYLPFWLASLLDRAVVVLLPALLVDSSAAALSAGLVQLAHQEPHRPPISATHGTRASVARGSGTGASGAAAHSVGANREIGHFSEDAGVARRATLRIAPTQALAVPPAE